jgi:ABC-type amino acid transport substrate-binding protein
MSEYRLPKIAKALIAALFSAWFGVSSCAAQTASSAQGPPRELIVATKEAPPFAMKTEAGAWTGISIELWTRLGEKLNFHTTFREFPTVPDMLAAVAEGKADAALAAITVTPERERTVDFSQPYYASGLGVAVPANKQIEWFAILRNVLTLRFLEAIAILITAAIVVGSTIWIIERRHTPHFSHDARGFGTGLWWSASAMTQAAAADKAPTTLWGRLLGMLWMISSIIIIASFTAGMTSQLAAQRLAAAVRTSADLAAVRTGSVVSTSAFQRLTSDHIDPRPYANVNAGMEALKAGRLDAFVYDRPILEYSVRKNFRDEVQVLDKLFARENYAIAVALNSPLRLQLDVAMLEEMRGDWWREVLSRYLGND